MTRRGKHHKGDQPEMGLMMLWPHSQLQKAKAMAKQKTRVSPRRMAATVRLSCKRPPATPARGKGRGEHGAKSEEGGWTMVGPKPRSHTADFKLRAQDWDKPLLDARKFADKLEAASASDVLTGVLFCVTRRKLTSSRRWSPAAQCSITLVVLHPDCDQRVPGLVGDQLQFRRAKTGYITPQNPTRVVLQWLSNQHINSLDSWAWKEEKVGKSSQLYGLLRVHEPDLSSVLSLSGRTQGRVQTFSIASVLDLGATWPSLPARCAMPTSPTPLRVRAR